MGEYSLDAGDTLPDFFGLSYCWGAPDRSYSLPVNYASLHISVDLRRGLSELAELPEFDGAYFWIDQICVNQDDLAERSHQVTLMHRIYRSATRTVIWLSSPSGSNPSNGGGSVHNFYDHGWELASRLHHLGHTQPDWSRTIDFLKAQYPLDRVVAASSLPSLGLPDASDPAWRELKHILENPWFSRMWVLQEAALSRVPPSLVHAGRCRVLEHVLWAGAWLWQSSGPRHFLEFPQSAVSNAYTMFIIVMSAIPWRIEPLLMGTDKFGATDMRDKVIGLLGLAAPESLPRKWAPDYRHSTAEVYRDMTRAVVEQTGRLLIFEGINYDCGPAYHTPAGLPSWTPRIHDVWAPVAATRLGKDASNRAAQQWREGFRACRGQLARVQDLLQQQTQDPDVLPLRGLQVDEVAWASPVLGKDDAEPYKMLRWVEEGLRRFCRPSDGEKGETPDAFVSRFFDALACAKYADAPTPADLRAYIREKADELPNRRALESLLPTETATAEGSDGGEAESVGFIESNCREITNFFVTKQNKIGFGPRWTAREDVVAALYGCEAPFVLRLRDQRHYLLLGCCYVPGWMDGEGIDLLEKGQIDEMWFWLK